MPYIMYGTDIVLYYIVLHHIVLYETVLYCTLRCGVCTVLAFNSSVLFSISYFILLYVFLRAIKSSPQTATDLGCGTGQIPDH